MYKRQNAELGHTQTNNLRVENTLNTQFSPDQKLRNFIAKNLTEKLKGKGSSQNLQDFESNALKYGTGFRSVGGFGSNKDLH